jgi:hypothetical protein
MLDLIALLSLSLSLSENFKLDASLRSGRRRLLENIARLIHFIFTDLPQKYSFKV